MKTTAAGSRQKGVGGAHQTLHKRQTTAPKRQTRIDTRQAAAAQQARSRNSAGGLEVFRSSYRWWENNHHCLKLLPQVPSIADNFLTLTSFGGAS